MRKGREGRTLGFVDDLPSGRDAEEWNCFPLPAKFPPYSQDMLLPIIYIHIYIPRFYIVPSNTYFKVIFLIIKSKIRENLYKINRDD